METGSTFTTASSVYDETRRSYTVKSYLKDYYIPRLKKMVDDPDLHHFAFLIIASGSSFLSKCISDLNYYEDVIAYNKRTGRKLSDATLFNNALMNIKPLAKSFSIL